MMRRTLRFLSWCSAVSVLGFLPAWGQEDPAASAPPPPDVERRALAGDLEAMKWVIRKQLRPPFGESGYNALPFRGIPIEADQVSLMIEILSEPSTTRSQQKERIYGIGWLYQQREYRAEQYLAGIATNPEEAFDVRSAALSGLVAADSIQAVDVIHRLAGEADPEIRLQVAEVCAVWRNPEAEGVLLKLSGDGDRVVHVNAVHCLKLWQEHTAEQIEDGKPADTPTPKTLKSFPQENADPHRTPSATPPLISYVSARNRRTVESENSTSETFVQITTGVLLAIFVIAVGVIFVRKATKA